MTSATTLSAAVAPRPPRSIAWLFLTGAAAAVLLVGMTTTALVLTRLSPSVPPGFWSALAAASALTIGGLGLRALRWVFLLRRAENTRVPILDAYVGYLSGFTLLLAPLLLGEIALRAWVLRARVRVPVARTAVVNLWERLLDVTAIVLIAGVGGASFAGAPWWTLVAVAALTLVGALRAVLMRAIVSGVTLIVRSGGIGDVRRLHDASTWIPALAVSVAAWILPATGLWLFLRAFAVDSPVASAWFLYAQSTIAGALVLAPGGIVVVGASLIESLARIGVDAPTAALVAFGVRMATVGVATTVGVLFLAVHVRRRAADSSVHFDDIALEYDVQIPEARRVALVGTKTALMEEVLRARGAGRRGLDVGCGQGWYVARLRELGYDVAGIDSSAAQIVRAREHVGDGGAVTTASILDIPSDANAYDFAYTINVLHHLGSIEEQRAAFSEMFRVLRPGGLLFVHEINTTNWLFRFYMGYVFPSLNCIDEGVERWLLPRALAAYTDAPVVDIRYFTFFPDFMPQSLVGALGPIERRLERSRLKVYSAHYMAVLQKPA